MARPLIGLALGSGAARGWAHIGILRALESAGIKPDILCGTSVGALVGGVYLCGHLDLLEDWVRQLGRLGILRYLDFRVSGGGMIGGDRLMALLHDGLGDTAIESLAIPFAAVATELYDGHEIWMQKGSVADAVRASFALPGVFTPMYRDGQWLVDGALVNPVPVSVCRALGARMVIAVNLNTDVFGKYRVTNGKPPNRREERLFDEGRYLAASDEGGGGRARSLLRQLFRSERDTPSVFSVMVASLNVIQDRLSRSRLAGDPPDLVVTPRLGHIGLLEFDRGSESIEEGRAAVERLLPDLHEALEALG